MVCIPTISMSAHETFEFFGTTVLTSGLLAAQHGGGGYTAAQWSNAAKQSFDRFFSADKVCDAGKGGRETLVFPFNTNEATTNPDGAALIYTTYLRYVISQMMDFFLEGADPRINDLWFKRLSHSLADLVLYPDSKKTLIIARTIAGDSPSSNERCGVPYEHDYRAPIPNVDRRWQDSAFAFLEGWESSKSSKAFDFRGRCANWRQDETYRCRFGLCACGMRLRE